MKPRVRIVSALSLVVALVSTGCADAGSVTAPQRHTGAPDALLGGLLGGVIQTVTSLLIPPVERNTALAEDITWSFTVDEDGAVSSNSTAGLLMVVPPNAVSSPTTITVTALAGKPVAYRFEPHGLQFNRRVYLTQNLRGTSAGGLLSLPVLSGAYFATDELELSSSGLATVTEIIPAFTSLWTRTATFPIEHFSGYILASGRGSSSDDQ